MIWSEFLETCKPDKKTPDWLRAVTYRLGGAGGTEAYEFRVRAMHSTKIDGTADIGDGCTIHETAEIGAGAVIGSGCTIGARVKIGAGVRLAEETRVDDDVFVGPETFITAPKQRIQAGARIGARCLIEGDTSIQPLAVIGDGVIIMAAFVGTQTVVGNGVRINGGCTIEGMVQIGDGAMLKSNAWVREAATVAPGAIVEPAPMSRRGFNEK